MNKKENKPYKMYVCLPYLTLQTDEPIGMGPIRFYSSTKFDNYIGKSEQEEIKSYFQNSPNINHGTCVCVHPLINDEDIPELLVDALYLIYFTATYQQLFHNQVPPLFSPLTKFVPARQSEANNPETIDSLKSLKVNQSKVISVNIQGNLMSEALGTLLNHSYLSINHDSQGDNQDESRRIIRAIRFFIHCFYEKFENLLGTGIYLKEKVYEPEDFLYLVTAFETLFDLHTDHPNSDFKQKLRPILHVKFGTPLETIWKWIDGFFEIKTQTIHQGTLPNGIFKVNRNFEIPYFIFGIKLFIYSAYFRLHQMGLLPAEKPETYIPIKFHGIEREEVIAFLWPESEILKKISIILMQITHGKHDDEYLYDLHMLAHIYEHMLKYHKESPSHIRFHPTEKTELKPFVDAIVNLSDEAVKIKGEVIHLHKIMPDHFISTIEKRVA